MGKSNKTESESGLIIKMVNEIVRAALTYHASDVHLEPENERLRIRFRIDGILREVANHPVSFLEPLVSRIKVLADLDIAERRKPQDGRISFELDKKELDLRVSIFPTLYGENVSLRLLDKTQIMLGLEHLGFSEEEYALYKKMIATPYGIIFVTGPNGSGKTTTLYSTLHTLNTIEKNIVTLEDPVEYQLPLIRQTQIDPDNGLTFASGLRSLLRQDPDIIMLGEIRDRDTADIAVRAALTGHLVLTTLHTNNAVGAISRLVDIGVEPVLISSATIGIIAQRLVRVVCPHCAEKIIPTPALIKEFSLENFKEINLVKSRGCQKCGAAGYLGRTAIFEILNLDNELKSLIISRAPYQTIFEQAQIKGMKSLREKGIMKAAAGITTLEEVLRVTSI
ncbi:MAG: GspE/PulE family protein [Patescibacteria group bacterium]